MKIKQFSLLLVIILVGIGNGIGAANFTSSVLIEKAVKEGKISAETGILYQVYRHFAGEKLPPEFRSEITEPCGTRLWLDLQENWQKLSAETKNEIEKYVKAQEHSEMVTFNTPIPSLDRTYSYGNFVIKYTVAGIHGVNLTDSDLDGIPDYIEKLGFYFQNYSWVMIKDLGYSLPPAPYTVNVFGLRRTYGMNGEVQLFDPVQTTVNGETKWISKSYINIDNNLDIVRTYTDTHEFFHAVQIYNGIGH